MKYRLQLGRRVDRTIAGALSSQIEEASSRLRTQADRIEAVHAARKSFKRIDALLWLGQAALGSKKVKRQRKKLKLLARRLAPRRDADVLVQVVRQLEAEYKAPANKRLFTALRALVEAHRDAVAQTAEAKDTAIVLKRLKGMQPAVAGLKFRTLDVSALTKAAASTYKLGRKAMLKVQASRDEKDMHNWRRYVQRHVRQMAFLKSLSPDEIAARITVADELGEVLGAHHDLAVLRTFAQGRLGEFARPEDLTRLEGVIDKKQMRLFRAAIPLGAMLFTERPKVFRQRLKVYCKTG